MQTVYTFGCAEVLTYIFNGIAAILGLGGRLGVFGAIAFTLGSLVAMLRATIRQNALEIPKWFGAFLLLTTLFYIPRASVFIVDPIQKTFNKVDNIPWILAKVASLTSTLGFRMTEELEQVFSLPDDLRYHQNGLLFAGRLVDASNHISISNHRIKQNFESFTQQCILYEVALGIKYTLNDLKTTNHMWELIKTHASPARSFVYEDEGQSLIITCLEGAARLEKDWKIITDAAMGKLSRIFYPHRLEKEAKVLLLQHLPMAYDYITKFSTDAQTIIQQKIMSQVVKNSITHYAADTESSHVHTFVAERTYEQQRSTYHAFGELASRTIPLMKIVFEALIYGLFPIVMTLSLLTITGFQTLLTYGGLIIWVQSWSMLYAVLHFILSIYTQKQCVGMTDIGLSWQASTMLSDINQDIGSLAGYLSMSIPFIAYAIIRGGAGSFVHLASHLGNVVQQLSSQAAGEITSGNLSYGNVSLGNTSYANTSNYKYNTDLIAQGESITLRTPQGVVESQFADGLSSWNSQGSISQGPVQISAGNQIAESLKEQAGFSMQEAKTHAKAYEEAKQSLYQQVIHEGLQSQWGQSSNESFAHEKVGSAERAFHEAFSIANHEAEQLGLRNQTHQEMGLQASLGNKAVALQLRGLLGTHEHTSAEKALTLAEQLSQNQDFRESMQMGIRALESKQFNESNSRMQHLSDQVSGSLQTMQTERVSEQEALTDAKNYQSTADWLKQESLHTHTHLTQDFRDWLLQNVGRESAETLWSGENVDKLAPLVKAYAKEKSDMYVSGYLEQKSINPVTLQSDYEQSSVATLQSNAYEALKEKVDDQELTYAFKDEAKEELTQVQGLTGKEEQSLKAHYEESSKRQHLSRLMHQRSDWQATPHGHILGGGIGQKSELSVEALRDYQSLWGGIKDVDRETIKNDFIAWGAKHMTKDDLELFAKGPDEQNMYYQQFKETIQTHMQIYHKDNPKGKARDAYQFAVQSSLHDKTY